MNPLLEFIKDCPVQSELQYYCYFKRLVFKHETITEDEEKVIDQHLQSTIPDQDNEIEYVLDAISIDEKSDNEPKEYPYIGVYLFTMVNDIAVPILSKETANKLKSPSIIPLDLSSVTKNDL